MKIFIERSNSSINDNKSRIKLNKLVLFLGLILIGSIIISGAVSAAGLATSPQPKIHHDNQNTGQSQYKGPQTNNTKWKYTTGAGVTSSPVIDSSGTLYIGSFDKNLYAINPNGTQKWNYTTGATIESAPAIGSDGTIYFGSEDGKLYALNPAGTPKWNYTTGNKIYSSPAIGNNGTIYIGSNDGKLYALNPTGTQKWNYTTGNSIYSSPAIGSDGTIYIGSNDGKLYALNPDGTQKWNYTTGDIISSSPAIGNDGTIYIGSRDNKLYALNPDGTQEWNYTTGYTILSSPAIGNDGTIYIASYDNKLYALNPDGTQKWNYTTGNPIFSSPAIGNDGTIYFGCFNNMFYALQPTGTQKWNYTTGNSILSSPAIGNDGTVYFGSFDNSLYAICDIIGYASVKGGYYNTKQTVTLNKNLPGTIYWKWYISTLRTNWNTYVSPIPITSTSNIEFFVKDLSGHSSQQYTEMYIIDNIPPTANSSLKNGLYNTNKIISLSMSEPGTIYYTLTGITPTTTSTKYTSPITVSSTTTLKFLAVDLAGNKSPIYTYIYTIDKTAPKVSTTTPTNLKTGVSRTSTIAIKFNENIKASTYFNKITIKNLSTGKTISISKGISGNTLNIKTTKRSANTWYTVTIPRAAIKDYASNNLAATYTFRFKTGT